MKHSENICLKDTVLRCSMICVSLVSSGISGNNVQTH